MSRSSPSRGQTEPLAALVAVLAVISGLVVYVGAVDTVLPGGSERSPADAAIDPLWNDLVADDRGVFPAHEYQTATDAAMQESIDPDSLPHGSTIYVELRTYDEGEPTVVAAAHFDSDGDEIDERQLDSSHEDFGPPGDAGGPDGTAVATRPVPIEVTPADVRGGTLHVEAW